MAAEHMTTVIGLYGYKRKDTIYPRNARSQKTQVVYPGHRFFRPKVGVSEDPVTGSVHCVLIPFWASVLGKNDLHARQVSKRGGELFCRLAGDRVRIAGREALYLEGKIKI
jgi:predicted PhzF superfamily epimerase YddE/YHI9